MHVMFRQYAQQMGMQNVRAILPEQIDLLLNTSVMDMVNSIIKENIGLTNDRVITDNSKIGQINALRSLYKVVLIDMSPKYAKDKVFDFNPSDILTGKMSTNCDKLVPTSEQIPDYLYLVDFSINYKSTLTGYSVVNNTVTTATQKLNTRAAIPPFGGYTIENPGTAEINNARIVVNYVSNGQTIGEEYITEDSIIVFDKVATDPENSEFIPLVHCDFEITDNNVYAVVKEGNWDSADLTINDYIGKYVINKKIGDSTVLTFSDTKPSNISLINGWITDNPVCKYNVYQDVVHVIKPIDPEPINPDIPIVNIETGIEFDPYAIETNFFPVRIIDDIYLADSLNDFVLKNRLRSPIMVVYNKDVYDIYIDKFIKQGDYYTLQNKLIPYKLRMSYIAKPAEISYNEDLVGENRDCDLPDYMHIDIVKHAVDLYRLAISGSMMGQRAQEQQAQQENMRNNYRNEGNPQQ